MPSQNNSLDFIRNSNTSQASIEINQIPNIESNRLAFSLDVKPEQKDTYKSDRINQYDDKKTNGYVARVQGIKTSAPKRSSVLPKVRVSDTNSFAEVEHKFAFIF
jgi:hypothetical protein